MAMEGLQKADLEGNELRLAKQNVAIAAIHLDEADPFAEAEHLIRDVLEQWKACHGIDHPTSLLATFSMVRVLLCSGRIRAAEDELLPALEVAESWLGSNDFSFLAARTLLACVKLH